VVPNAPYEKREIAMRRHLTWIIPHAVAVALLAGVVPALLAADAKDDEHMLSGVWEQTFAERDGIRKSLAEAKLKHIKATVTFDEGAATFRMEHAPVEGKTKMEIIEMKYTVDASKTPHEVDFIIMREGKELRTLGIFKRDKNELVIALDSHEGRGQRPKDFVTQKGDGFDIITMKPAQEKKEDKKD
jgi:uncharacterized protein (TIGR03067 family)